MLTAVCHSGADGWHQVENLATISDLVTKKDHVVWAHAEVNEVSRDDIATIADELGLDPLAVEDAMNLGQRPKLEQYENHLFAVMHQLDEVDGQLEARQIACFIGPRWVLTVHESSSRTIDETMIRCTRTQRGDGQGPSFVMHALLDTIVDDYERHADELEDEIERIEEIVLRDPHVPLQSKLYSLKQRLSRLRRYAQPGERVLSGLLGAGKPASTGERTGKRADVGERTAALFRDVHDHLLRILDQVRNVEDLVNAVLELQRAEQTQALNEVTKRLTGWAAIIAVPTLIASTYGMNFRLVPRDQTLGGFGIALGMMVSAGVGLYVYFKRRNWI